MRRMYLFRADEPSSKKAAVWQQVSTCRFAQ